MGDLISRQAAIDAIRELEKVDDFASYYCALSDAEERLMELPSAQPDHINGRKAYQSGYAEGYAQGKKDAQPEIIRCKECKKNPHWEWVGCPMTGKGTRKPDDFCTPYTV